MSAPPGQWACALRLLRAQLPAAQLRAPGAAASWLSDRLGQGWAALGRAPQLSPCSQLTAASMLALIAASRALWRAVGEARLGAGSLACGAPSMASRSEATAITGLTAQTSRNYQANRFVKAQ